MKQRPYTLVFTVVATALFVAPISLAHILTKPRVALNEEAFLKRSVLRAAGVPLPATDAEVVTTFAARAQAIDSSSYRITDEGGEPAGFVLLRSGPGLWGEITAAVGFRSDLERLTGVDFLAQSETPGLGARITESWFTEQFRGKRGPFSTVPEGEPSGETEFDAITGATLTSSYVKAILNDAVTAAKALPR